MPTMLATVLDTANRFLGSRKAVTAALAVSATLAAMFTHQLDTDKAMDFIKWIMGTWLVAQGATDAAMHIGGGGSDPPAPPAAGS